ncbi:MAG TPA: tRNA (uridine(54)-C5)-methyltransferase TrmA [Accumulibacter sp.]|nr:tRNA (uridine(54)-C5)-methyltransferase TrmA [Accumulibacter sp.]HMW16446.1 tRNA (uridine(54)-C5)-methyltransferase TrmA [Accumulibacter sp.]HMX21409.1 tRNA (uridine(54)-C5)-methyltransferase TrmA [Accumulibacter sp.]HMY07453.1 tRNA (uridine(54)-C5)-methyltransferase TrmA [Accumulibacter sp.]HNC16676.1 tRNA (uridine(54)-C5)-methyltransferase TrmA [Accumulibacter sp.]
MPDSSPQVPASAPQLAEKVAQWRQLMASFGTPEPSVHPSPARHYRQRAEFRLWRQGEQRHYAMFAAGDKRSPILLDDFPAASQRINVLMPELRKAWQTNPALSAGLFQVEFLSTLTGEALITLCYHRRLDETWLSSAHDLAEALQVSIIGRSRGQKIVIGRDHVFEEMIVHGRGFRYRQPEGAFTQPNGAVNQAMLNWACAAVGQRDDDLLELYCGNGNFTLPLATRVRRILATEVSKASVHAALANLADNHIDNVTLVRLSAEELTQALNGVRPFRRLAGVDLTSYRFATVLVDPPRAGLDMATCELLRRYPRIVYISCQPSTLAANIAQLADTHRPARCAVFDQFPGTPHLESGVLLERR